MERARAAREGAADAFHRLGLDDVHVPYIAKIYNWDEKPYYAGGGTGLDEAVLNGCILTWTGHTMGLQSTGDEILLFTGLAPFVEAAAAKWAFAEAASYSASSGAVAIEAEEFIGPTIGRSGYRTMEEFNRAVGAKYQQLVDQGYADTMHRVAQGLVRNDPMVIGSEIDAYARAGMRDWLATSEGIVEGPGAIIQVNRRLYDPSGTGAFRVPDVYIPGARSIYDATIAEKSVFLPQAIDFRAFSGGGNITIVRPSTLVTPGATGSYGLHFP